IVSWPSDARELPRESQHDRTPVSELSIRQTNLHWRHPSLPWPHAPTILPAQNTPHSQRARADRGLLPQKYKAAPEKHFSIQPPPPIRAAPRHPKSLPFSRTHLAEPITP